MSVRIAVVQQASEPGAVEENRARALHFARKGLEEKADIILFHEELLVGYVENLKELAEEVDGPTTRAFQALLQETDSLILYGLTERDGDACYISATWSISAWRPRGSRFSTRCRKPSSGSGRRTGGRRPTIRSL